MLVMSLFLTFRPTGDLAAGSDITAIGATVAGVALDQAVIQLSRSQRFLRPGLSRTDRANRSTKRSRTLAWRASFVFSCAGGPRAHQASTRVEHPGFGDKPRRLGVPGHRVT
jgi:hypothetical protein